MKIRTYDATTTTRRENTTINMYHEGMTIENDKNVRMKLKQNWENCACINLGALFPCNDSNSWKFLRQIYSMFKRTN